MDYFDYYHRRVSWWVYRSLRDVHYVPGELESFDEFLPAFCSRCRLNGQTDHPIAGIAGNTRTSQESGTNPAIAAGRAQKKTAHWATCAVVKSIRISSSCFPGLSREENQRGLFPNLPKSRTAARDFYISQKRDTAARLNSIKALPRFAGLANHPRSTVPIPLQGSANDLLRNKANSLHHLPTETSESN